MNETERNALVDELHAELETAYGMRWGVDSMGVVMTIMPIIDRLLAAADAPGLDELLDSVHPKATIDTLITYDDGTWAVTIVHPIKPTGSYGQSLTSEILAYNATGPNRDEALLNAVAQATTTQEGGEGE